MNAKVFIDTHVLLYAIDEDPASTSKRQRGCRTVYSEDLNAGQNYDGVTVINPFVAGAAT